MTTHSPRDLDSYRNFFPHVKEHIYLDHASVAPLSIPVKEAITKYLHYRHVGRIVDVDKFFKLSQALRSELAALIHAESADTIAFVPNTTSGLNILANGLPLERGDRILITDCEFPANVFPFLNREKEGIHVDFVPCRNGKIYLEDLFAAVTPDTKLISLSLVEFFSGFRHDASKIGAFCRDRGITFALDAIQALGAMHVNVHDWQVDFLAAGGQKWLLSPMGTGFIYVAPHLLPKLAITDLGWIGMRDAFNFFDYTIRPLPTAARFEQGSLPVIALQGMMAAITMIRSIDPEVLENRILHLSGYLIEKLLRKDFQVVTPREPARRAGIVLFSAGDKNARILKQLRQKKITLSLRENKLRASPHFYNNEEDLDFLVDSLCEITRK